MLAEELRRPPTARDAAFWLLMTKYAPMYEALEKDHAAMISTEVIRRPEKE
jgi:hypothetical protein